MNIISRRWPLAMPAAVSAALALALYAVTLGGTYIFDDVALLLNEHRLQQPRLWYAYWTESYHDGVDNLYRPLTSMTYALQWAIHGLEHAWAFHLVNVLLHAAASALVAELARRLAGVPTALLAGLLFAAHPIHVEAVANVIGRAELLCALGTVGGMALALHRPLSMGRMLAIVSCFILALLSKEQGMLFPLLLLMLFAGARLAAHPAAAPLTSPRERRALLWLVLLLCWLLAAYIFLRENVLPLKFWWDRSTLDWTINPMIRAEGHHRWLMPFVLLGRYAQLMIAPVQLSIDYGGSVIGWKVRFDDPYLYAGIAAALAWIGGIILAWRRRAGVALFCLLAAAVTYGVIGNIVSLIGTNFGERLMYLPSVFLLILAGLWLGRLRREWVIGIAALVLIGASVRTVTYAGKWNDRLEFYRYSLERQPRSIRLHMLLTAELQSRGLHEQAEQQVAAGRALESEYWDIWVHSALVAMDLGKLDEAEQFLTQAMKLKPSPQVAALRDHVAQMRAEAATQPSLDENAPAPAADPDPSGEVLLSR